MSGRSIRANACALAFALGIACAHAQDIVALDQGWSNQDKRTWYTLTQGSRLVPQAWLQALEQPGPAGTPPQFFLDRAHIEKFRYLPADTDGQLPIGFAVDIQNDENLTKTKLRWKSGQSKNEPWVGFTCSACHTTELTFQGKRIRIDGAPTLADFQNFMVALNVALAETRDDVPGKFKRFAERVLKGGNTPDNRASLMGTLNTLLDWQLQVEAANKTPLQYGFARLDAFGHIFNKVLLRVEGDNQRRNPSDAPVSYPFLWNIHQHDKVQWNGIAPNGPRIGNLDIGALGRNVGEVLGVFADLRILPVGPAIIGYPSSANVTNLNRLEQQLTRLKPPAWPDALPPIDPAKWEAGKALFEKKPDGCASCHKVLARSDVETPFEVSMEPLIGERPIGTDPWMACNAYTYQAQLELMKFTPKKFFAFSSPPMSDPESVATMLGATVIGVMWNKKDEVLKSVKSKDMQQILKNAKPFELKKGAKVFDSDEFIAQFFPTVPSGDKAARLKRCFEEASATLAYKGRPLNGVWATAPFLHNGSVPTLYDLLLPPKDRAPSFALGTRDFDPEKVGYVTTGSKFETDQSKAQNSFVFNTRDGAGVIPGNSNSGHDYNNAALAETDRLALVEYMKAVGGRRVGDKIVE
jgi:hypothetical protein